MDEQEGAGRLVRRRVPPGIKEWDLPHSLDKKNPRMHTACLGSGRMVSGSTQLINQVVYSVSAPFPIIKGWFKIHISYMGIANMIKNVIVMSTSPVNRVNTKRGDT